MMNLDTNIKFVPKRSEPKAGAFFLLEKQLNIIKSEAIRRGFLHYDESGKFEYALAPNGEKSNLNEKQWLQVRTENFKNWFGDWEKNTEHSVDLLDKNGEPHIFYHGTTKKFEIFSHQAPKTFDIDNVKGVFYLTSNKEFAKTEYADFKWNLIKDALRHFNTIFFEGKEESWDRLIDKWNDFIKSIGTEKVNFRKKVFDSKGGFHDWTLVEYDGKDIFPTDELEKLWDNDLPTYFKEDEYEEVQIDKSKILLPKNTRPIVMSLFIRTINPLYKKVQHDNANEMDILFTEGLFEKGVLHYDKRQLHIEKSPGFASKREIDSIVVELQGGGLAVAVFDSNQLKSTETNNGLFSLKNDNITM
jgi:hypothetical protein